MGLSSKGFKKEVSRLESALDNSRKYIEIRDTQLKAVEHDRDRLMSEKHEWQKYCEEQYSKIIALEKQVRELEIAKEYAENLNRELV
tara:strand:+ start:1559 stop:1819 length:261 start_codon:yes stop_codon:yes gene_type:complete